MITLTHVSVELPSNSPDSRTILDDVTLSIAPGEWVALAGANGSGKTTLLHTLAGLLAPSAGTLEAERQDHKTALLLQEPDNQFITTSVRYELALSVASDERSGGEDARNGRGIADAVERFGLTPFLDRNPHRLSGGEKQRLALATVWLQNPRLLLLDEPTAYLDAASASLCAEFVADACRDGVAAVWATPGGDDLTLAGRVVCLDAGRVVYDGTVEGVYGWASGAGCDVGLPRLRRLAGDMAAALVTGDGGESVVEAASRGVDALADSIASMAVDVVPGDRRDEASRAGFIIARDVSQPRAGFIIARDVSQPRAGNAVEFDAVDFGYDGRPAVTGVDIGVPRGECVGLTGPNGAGKSTVLGLAAGLFEPSAGSVVRNTDGGPARRDVFYLFQSPERMFFAETVAEELEFGLERLGLARNECGQRARSALESAGLAGSEYPGRAPLSLSPGEMRRVAFAIALSLEPELLLLDEPTSCLDGGGVTVLESILAARRLGGGTTMVASHDVAFLVGVCDRIVWLDGGRAETALVTTGAELAFGAVWPGDPLDVLDLQERLAVRGLDVVPRALTAARLASRLERRPQGG